MKTRTWRRLGTKIFIAAGIAAPSPAWCQDGQAPGAKELNALVDQYLAVPFQHHALRTALHDSAQARPDVAITISAGVVPWLCGNDTAQTVHKAMTSLLLGAFEAGNMRAQLETGQKGDQPYAAVQATLGVYRRIQEKIVNFRIPVLDDWSGLGAQGALRAHIDSVAANPPADCP